MASSVINVNINAIVKGNQSVNNLTIDLNALAQAAEGVQQKMKFSDFLSGCGGLVTSAQGLLNALGPVTEGFEAFDSAMRKANTMAGKSEAEFDRLKGQVAALGTELRGISREALADGLYQAISNGVPEDNWLSFLEASAKASVGGLADLGGVITVTSTMIKNYGLEWEDAAAIQDKIQTTAKNGVTSFEQLQQALPKVTGNAATLGVTVDELMASFATLTGVSGNTAEVSTQMAAIFTALVKPSSQAAKMAQEMGVQFDAAAIKAAGGFQSFVTSLDASVKQYSAATGELEQEVYAKLFGSAEALRALGPLTGQLAEKYAENVEAMKDSTGAIGQAYEQVGSTAAAALQQMQNRIAAYTDSVARAVSAVKPYAESVAYLVQGASGVAAMGGAMVKAGKSAAALAQSIRTAGLAAKVFGVTLRTALITSGVGLAIVAITTAMGHFMAKADQAAQKAEELRQKQQALADDIKSTFNGAVASATTEIEGEARALKKLIDAGDSTAEAVRRLNSTYGETFKNHQTAAEWYDILTKKSREYAKAKGYEAIVTSLGGKAATQDLAIDGLKEELAALEKERALLKRRGKYNERYVTNKNGLKEGRGRSRAGSRIDGEIRRKQEEIRQEEAALQSLYTEMDKAQAKADAIFADVKQPTITPEAPKTDPAPAAKQLKSAAELAAQAQEKFRASLAAADSEAAAALASLGSLASAYDRLTRGANDAALSAAAVMNAVQHTDTSTLAAIDLALARLREAQSTATAENIAGINREIKALQEKRQALLDLGVEEDKDKNEEPKKKKEGGLSLATRGWGDIKGIASSVQTLGNVADQAASPWERLTSAIDGALGVMQGIAGIIDLMKQLGIIAPATAAAEAAAAQVSAEAAQADANAQLTDAAAKTMNAHAWMPFVGIGLAAASVAMMIATMAGLPKFAEGGIAYGPTLGLFGEYPGAKTNPEVVAPLSRLQAMLDGGGGGGRGRVSEFRLRARTLVAAIGEERRLSARLK